MRTAGALIVVPASLVAVERLWDRAAVLDFMHQRRVHGGKDENATSLPLSLSFYLNRSSRYCVMCEYKPIVMSSVNSISWSLR